MKKLNLAIIGCGRSGKDIHGKYYRGENNVYFNIAYVADKDEISRTRAKKLYPGCIALSDYRELFDKRDIDIIVNASYSEMHYTITKELLQHKFNVLTEKPMARNRYECEDLIKTADENGVLLAVFQQTFLAPIYTKTHEIIKSGMLGEVKQINIRYNSFSRRWDWQTLQKKLGGSVYNTGPHPIGMALGFMDFDKSSQVVYSKLDTALTSGDADDYAKIIMTAPGKPLIDIEINPMDPYTDYTLKVQGTNGCFKSGSTDYEYQYIIEDENPKHPYVEETLRDENHEPIYCSEKLVIHKKDGKLEGSAFDTAVNLFYENLYYALTENRVLYVPAENVVEIMGVVEKVHADNPLPLKY